MTESPTGTGEAVYDTFVSGGVRWTARQDVRGLFEGPGAEDWSALGQEGHGRAIEMAEGRGIFQVEWKPAGQARPMKLRVKTHRHLRWTDTLRNMTGKGRLRKEWEALKALKRMGLGCAEAVAIGERREWGAVTEEYLVTEAVGGGWG